MIPTIESFKRGEWAIQYTFSSENKEYLQRFLDESYPTNPMPNGVHDCFYWGDKDRWIYTSAPTTIPTFHIDYIKNAGMLASESKCKVRAEFVQKAYKDADDETKKQIEKNVDMFRGETSKQFIKDMMKKFHACKWYDLLRNEYPSLDIDKTIDINKVEMSQLITPQTVGKYAGKAYALNSLCDWKIELSSDNKIILIPTQK